MPDHFWSFYWQIDNKKITLSRESHSLTVTADAGTRFSFTFKDPISVSKVFRQIADALSQCHNVDTDEFGDNPKYCVESGKIRTKYALVLCDGHFKAMKDAEREFEEYAAKHPYNEEEF